MKNIHEKVHYFRKDYATLCVQFEARAGAIIHGVVIELLKWLFAWDGKKSNLPRNLARFSGGVLHSA